MSGRATRLCYAVRPIDAGMLARLRVHAYESGRVIERDGRPCRLPQRVKALFEAAADKVVPVEPAEP